MHVVKAIGAGAQITVVPESDLEVLRVGAQIAWANKSEPLANTNSGAPSLPPAKVRKRIPPPEQMREGDFSLVLMTGGHLKGKGKLSIPANVAFSEDNLTSGMRTRGRAGISWSRLNF
jgi:hypothetical protein